MLIITLTKAVPSRTTQVITAGGVLKREAMELVLNPHDMKAFEAADYIKRAHGGKHVALSMGPHPKLIPLSAPLFYSQVEGVDEIYILSDRRMAGADTWATSYTLARGIKKLLEVHLEALRELKALLVANAPMAEIEAKAKELYDRNLLPNELYSGLPPVKDHLVARLKSGAISVEQALSQLEAHEEELSRFIVLAGVKTTDGETGSTGPQVAEALSSLLGRVVGHITFVSEFEIHAFEVRALRRIGSYLQKLSSPLPVLLTISPSYRPPPAPAASKVAVRAKGYRGKVLQPIVWDAAAIGAEPDKIGLAGSPTLVGPGVDIGRPPVRKFVGRTLVFVEDVPALSWDGQSFGPFKRGDPADSLPEALKEVLLRGGKLAVFSLPMLVKEVFGA